MSNSGDLAIGIRILIMVRSLLWLLLIPFAVLVYAIRLPGFFAPSAVFEADPSYFFLMNSLNIVMGHPVWYINQPGTTVETIGAVTIRVVHGIVGSGDIVTDVIQRPGMYVTAFYLVLMMPYVVALMALGIVAWRYTGKLGDAVAIQATPFLLGFVAAPSVGRDRLVPLSSECLVVTVVAVLISLVLRWSGDGRHSIWRPAMYGAVVGFGLVTKLTTAPLALIPLLVLRNVREVAWFATAVAVSFVLFTAPIWSEYPRFARKMIEDVTHGAAGGSGAPTLTISQWLTRLLQLGLADPILATLLVVGATMLARRGLSQISARRSWTPTDRLMIGVVLCGIAVFIMAAIKPADAHYLLPARATAGLLVWLVIDRVPRARSWTTQPRLLALGAATALLLVLPVLPFWREQQRKLDVAAVQHELDVHYASSAKVFYRGASSVAYFLQRGNWEAGSPYTEALSAMYPNVYFYHSSPCCTWRGAPIGLFDWGGQRMNLADVQAGYDKVVFVGARLLDEHGGVSGRLPDDDHPASNWGPVPAPLREVFRRGDEAIYEVVKQ